MNNTAPTQTKRSNISSSSSSSSVAGVAPSLCLAFINIKNAL